MKRILVVCETKTAREEIINIVKSVGYNISKVKNDTGAMGFFRNGEVADLIIIGHRTQASEVLTKWIRNNRSWIPIVFISSCECESDGIIHTNNDGEVVEKSCLIKELPAVINHLIGPPDPLK